MSNSSRVPYKGNNRQTAFVQTKTTIVCGWRHPVTNWRLPVFMIKYLMHWLYQTDNNYNYIEIFVLSKGWTLEDIQRLCPVCTSLVLYFMVVLIMYYNYKRTEHVRVSHGTTEYLYYSSLTPEHSPGHRFRHQKYLLGIMPSD